VGHDILAALYDGEADAARLLKQLIGEALSKLIVWLGKPVGIKENLHPSSYRLLGHSDRGARMLPAALQPVRR
jgi:hypothetical protein